MSICFQKKLLQKDYICEYNLGWGLVCFHLEALQYNMIVEVFY
jgi:hypothetical protein